MLRENIYYVMGFRQQSWMIGFLYLMEQRDLRIKQQAWEKANGY